MKRHVSPHASRFLKLHARAALWLCLIWTGAIHADRPVGVEVELTAELRVPQAAETQVYQFIPATRVQQGQEISYTLQIRNPGTAPLDRVSIVRALPLNTRYVAGSANGAGADIQFSVDGGQSFARPSELKSMADPRRVAATDQYTHIRWQLRHPLAPKAVVLARFRAVFQ